MKPKDEHILTLQSNKTVKYGAKQHYQHRLTIPAPIWRSWGLEDSPPRDVYVRLKTLPSGEILITKLLRKPTQELKWNYQRWLERIRLHLPTEPPGRSIPEIYQVAGIEMKSVPAVWVRDAQRDIGLNRNFDTIKHRTLWWRNTEEATTSEGHQRFVDAKLTDLTLQCAKSQTIEATRQRR